MNLLVIEILDDNLWYTIFGDFPSLPSLLPCHGSCCSCSNYYYITLWKFLHQLTLVVFHWSLSDCQSLQVSRNLFSSGRPQHCCSLDGLDLSSDINLFQYLFKAFGDRSKRANYSWYHRYLHVPQARSKYLSLFSFLFCFVFFTFTLLGR